ncbi:MAG TPA: antibiotic biosynthesis monooxygenase [Trebonia sp.]|nr:antibiotic biosynthesis monooxygenase [Trebonia sp.]
MTAQYGGLPSAQDAGPGFPDFTALDAAAPENGNSTGTPRPYGRLSIFTLLEDKVAEFDRLAERAAEGVRTTEPDTLVYVIHVVPKAPMQRIIYEIYRDRAAMESHERQPHIQRFIDDRKACVLATNVIDLRLKYAKVAALGTPQASQTPHVPQEAQYSQDAQTTQAPWAVESGTGAYASHDAGGFGGRRDWPADPARDQYAAAAAGRYSDTRRYAELGAGSQSEAGRYAGGSGQFPEQSRDGQPSYQGQRYGGR